MANTYHKIHIHTIFAVKFRNGLIQPQWEERLYSVIGNLISESGGKPIIVAISEIMKSAKAKSSKWINENNLLQHRFEWQSGYGCFSYGHSQKNDVYQYILNQKEHHKKMSFRDEYEKLLKMFEIDYDERFLFKNLK